MERVVLRSTEFWWVRCPLLTKGHEWTENSCDWVYSCTTHCTPKILFENHTVPHYPIYRTRISTWTNRYWFTGLSVFFPPHLDSIKCRIERQEKKREKRTGHRIDVDCREPSRNYFGQFLTNKICSLHKYMEGQLSFLDLIALLWTD